MPPANRLRHSKLEARDTLVSSGTLKAETDWSYDEWALHGCVPALAKRLDPSLGLQLREDLISARDDQDLLHSIQLVVPHTRFTQATESSDEARAAVEFLFGGRIHGGALALALDTIVPGYHPGRVKVDSRAPFSGVQLIGSYGDHDRVLCYAESEEKLDDLYQAAVAKRQCEDLSGEEVALLRELRCWPERLDFDALSIQDFDGTVISEQSFLHQEVSVPAM